MNVNRPWDIGERNVWRLAAAAGYNRGELEALGYAVQAQTYRVNDVDCDNLEVVIPGAARPEQIVLVGAHYDTAEGSPGADDNASGVAYDPVVADACLKLFREKDYAIPA